MNLTTERLNIPSEIVTDFKDCYLKGIKVAQWVKNKNAYAVAFNQLGMKERCFVSAKKKLKFKDSIIINPSYKPVDDFEVIISQEGCLSYPGEIFEIKRFDKIIAEYYIFDTGNIVRKIIEELKDISSIVFQHETDHLDGITDIEKDIRKDKK